MEPTSRLRSRSALTPNATSANKVVKAELGNPYKGGEADVARGGSMCRRAVPARANFFPKIKRKQKAGRRPFGFFCHSAPSTDRCVSRNIQPPLYIKTFSTHCIC